MEPITIMLVDDHELVLDGIRSILEGVAWINVVGTAPSAEAAMPLLRTLRPSVLLTDITLGAASGQWLTERVTEQYPDTRVVVLSMHESAAQVAALMGAGASGYLLKNVKLEELLLAIKTVDEGGHYVQQSIAAAYRSGRRKPGREKDSHLTPRETEIIRLIVDGLSTPEISQRLVLSEFTVETHRKNIGRKTGARTPLTLSKWARENGLL
ncbi:MAG: response regulator transcription factor [Sphingobacteriales bacterium]|nr:MAG: response regulator transcription factor [Sphingobacteriales bacterium]